MLNLLDRDAPWTISTLDMIRRTLPNVALFLASEESS
jgi:hypothetical protein